MTIRAYHEMYVSKAQSVLADAFDYAVNTCEIPGEEFVKMFLGSSISQRMELGDPACIAGKSGIEIVLDIVEETRGEMLDVLPPIYLGRSNEYWIGWVIAYYQWYSDRKFSEIFAALSFEDLKEMYYALHEADISKFVEIADRIIKEKFPDTNLKRLRTLCRHTQAELAERSGVRLRSIQMYEQRNKDINKASAETVYRLAKVLGCTIEDLMEK